MFIENHWPETHTNWLMSPQYSTYSQEMRGDILIRIPSVCCDIIFTTEKDIPLMRIPCAFITTILVGYYHVTSFPAGSSEDMNSIIGMFKLFINYSKLPHHQVLAYPHPDLTRSKYSCILYFCPKAKAPSSSKFESNFKMMGEQRFSQYSNDF